MLRVRVDELVAASRWVCLVQRYAECDVSGAAHRVLLALALYGIELVRQTEVDVVAEAALGRSVLLVRIERLNHVRASIRSPVSTGHPMLRCLREPFHVDQQILRPILDI